MISVLQYGFGSVGRWTTEIILRRKNLQLMGVIDTDPSLQGKDPGVLLGIGDTGLRIGGPEDIIPSINADVVSHSTVTDLDVFLDQIRPCIESGMSIITSSEDVIYPWRTHPDLANRIDSLAKKNNVSILATGVNPGFATDLLPLILCGASDVVDSVSVLRVVDFSEYPYFKPPYMGFGMLPSEFNQKVTDGVWGLGRNPLPGRIQNLHLIADTLGWTLDVTSINYAPIISKSVRETPWGFSIESGMVAGVKQTGLGIVDGEEKIRLESIAICHPRPEEDGLEVGNIISIKGNPSHHLTLQGGTVQNGGYVTSSRIVNYIPTVIAAKPGLLSMSDLPAILGKNVAIRTN
ncbi:MAG: NAD(P)H-dependent amine dehydrogenase family protein [Candidatus Thorarchaeota archaeon]